MRKNVGIFIFDNVEVLDFAGPFEVFSISKQIHTEPLFDVFTIAPMHCDVRAVNGLTVVPDYSLFDHPPIDILVIAGGGGTRKLLDNSIVLNWLEKQYEKCEVILSICSGARLFASIGLLNEQPFCTHQGIYEHVLTLAPSSIPQTNKRFVKTTEKLYTSGGISAGIDLSFHIVEAFFGKTRASEIAAYMEYQVTN